MSSSNALRGIVDDLPMSKLKTSKCQLRSLRYNIEDLIESIRQKGLLQPIIVRCLEDDKYDIIAGNRRYEACRRLSWRRITCHIVELNDKESFELSLIENIQRETLNPIDEAKAFKIYIAESGWGGVSELAKKIGKSPSYVSKRISLLDLPQQVIPSVEDSSLCPSIAEELYAIKDKAKQSELAHLITRRELTVRTVRELISQVKQNDHDFETKPSYYKECEERKRRIERAFDKSITTLRITLNRISIVMEDVEDDGWTIKEILLQHKNMINDQINILFKEKRKYSIGSIERILAK
jgi:ParB family transcriptional regulator, chromosome partitioning protein